MSDIFGTPSKEVTTQSDMILDHLADKGTISAMEAQNLYRITSTTKVISMLRRIGYAITSEWRTDHTGKRYKRYFGDGYSASR